MKNLILTICWIVASCGACYSQSFSLANDAGPLANGSELVLSGPSDTIQLITWLHLTNLTADSFPVMMKKEDISVPEGATSSICWAGFCNRPDIYVSEVPLLMKAGETVSGCFGHFIPNGYRGISIVRWTFFKESDPLDSVSLTVHYSTFPTGMEKNPEILYTFEMASPTPADYQIILRYALPPGKHGHAELRNLAGNVVAGSEPLFLSGEVVFNTRSLPTGLYCCSLLIDSQPVITRKVPVYHK